jgi:hypothetical protein
VSALLMVAFIIGVASAWARGLTIDCGCFGGGGQVAASETKYPEEILRDIGLVLLGGWLVVFGAGRFALDGRSRSNGNHGHESTDLDVAGDTPRDTAEDREVETATGRDE